MLLKLDGSKVDRFDISANPFFGNMLSHCVLKLKQKLFLVVGMLNAMSFCANNFYSCKRGCVTDLSRAGV